MGAWWLAGACYFWCCQGLKILGKRILLEGIFLEFKIKNYLCFWIGQLGILFMFG